MDPELLKWGLTQSPIALVLLIILHYYRQDMRRIQAKDEEKTSILTDLVGRSMSVLTANSAQMGEMNRTLERVAVELTRLGK